MGTAIDFSGSNQVHWKGQHVDAPEPNLMPAVGKYNVLLRQLGRDNDLEVETGYQITGLCPANVRSRGYPLSLQLREYAHPFRI
jgi:hypothetical protein